MYRVSKVLNNNGVIAIDMDENKEYVILGKGVGFGKKVSQRFDKPEGCTPALFPLPVPSQIHALSPVPDDM